MNSRIKLADLEVNRLGYGAMRVCGPSVWGPPKDRAHALRVLRRACARSFGGPHTEGPHTRIAP